MSKEEVAALVAEALQAAGVMTKQEFGATTGSMIKNLMTSVDNLKAHNPLDALVTAGLLEKAEDGSYKAKVAVAPKKDNEPEWKVQLQQMQEQISAKDKQIAAERTQREQAELKSAVISALEQAGAVNPSRDYVHVMGQVQRGEDGKFFVPKKNQYGADEPIALDKAFGEFLGTNPELRKAAAHTGSGTPFVPGSTSLQSGKPDVAALAAMTMDQFVAAQKK